ncbi:hypothetical protein ONZ51_g6767 [Trametes cubensis]|uniref:Uncharacterized protein n=1 Tax=Trametes cubensis TaxID=1111947 RepID=A0AAD7TRM2_9APHY|nr:hypothetical protein ONZ51_g6767 [Trametes cubensis]
MPISVQSIMTLNNPSIAFLPAALAGFVGADDTADALTQSYVYGRRNILSLYNSPGSYGVGRLLKSLARSHFWDGLHAGASIDPDAFTQAVAKTRGPKFTAAFSGTSIESTGEIANILATHCKNLPIEGVAEGRVTTPFAVTIANLYHTPSSEEHPTLKANAPFLPILASVGASAACAAIGDWHCFSMIVLGMFCNAATSTALRTGDLTFTRPNTTPGAPAGDGFLEIGNEIVVLQGSESAVGSVTRGRFSLRFPSEKALGRLATCATMSTFQCLAQLFIVPQGTLLGQLFFVLSLAIAWLYNSFMASAAKKAKAKVVVDDVLKTPSMQRYSLGSRSAMAVFLMQVLKPANVEEQLAALIPNKTRVWTAWRQIVARRLRDEKPTFEATVRPAGTENFSPEESTLLHTLLGDAQAAVNVYGAARGRY